MTNLSDYPHLTVHADGACEGNPGRGGWAAIFTHDDREVMRASGYDPDTTNNRMELTAAIEALKLVANAPSLPLTLISDSEYVVKGINEWMAAWKPRGWRTAAKKPVMNVEMWQALDALLVARTVAPVAKWVKGHNGDRWNEEADRLAVSAMTGEPSISVSAVKPINAMGDKLAALKHAHLLQRSAFGRLMELCGEASWDAAQSNRLKYLATEHAKATEESERALEAMESAAHG